jgi:hypothetical protein
VFFRPNSGKKTPPAERPTNCMWAYHRLTLTYPAKSAWVYASA